MKTSISIPDPLFDAIDRTARALGISRSELLQRAAERYLRDHDEQAVTAALDEVYGSQESALSPELHRAQVAALEPEDW